MFSLLRPSVSQKPSARSGCGGSLRRRDSGHGSGGTHGAAAVLHGAGLGAGPQDPPPAQVCSCSDRSRSVRPSVTQCPSLPSQAPEDSHQTTVLRRRLRLVCERECGIHRPRPEISAGGQAGQIETSRCSLQSLLFTKAVFI